MPPLARENPFLAGLREAADRSAHTTEVVGEVNRRQAVSRFMSNMRGVTQAIEAREVQRLDAHQKRLEDYIKRDQETRTGVKGETTEAMYARMHADQLALAVEEQAFAAAQAKDMAMARNLVANSAYTMSQMTAGERETVGMLMGDQVQGAVGRLLGGRGRGTGGMSLPKLPDPSDMYEFKSIQTATGDVYGRVNKLTGRFEEQGKFEDPGALLDMQLKLAEVENIPLSRESKEANTEYVKAQTRAMQAKNFLGNTEVHGFGNTDLLERTEAAPKDFPTWDEKRQEAYLAARSASIGIPGLKADYDPASNMFVFRGMASNVKSSGGGGSAEDRLTPNKLADLQLKLSSIQGQIAAAKSETEKRGLMNTYNSLLSTVNRMSGRPVGRPYRTDWKTKDERKSSWDSFHREYLKAYPEDYKSYQDTWKNYSSAQKKHFNNDFSRFLFWMRNQGK